MIRPTEIPVTTPQRRRAAHQIEVSTHDLYIVGLPESMVGRTLVQLSDFHRGCGRADPLIQAAVARANALDPDYTVLTGDYVNQHKRDILPVVRMLSGLQARRGVFASLGNHDHRGDALLLATAMDAAGIHVLDNDAVEIESGFWLAGVDELYEGRPDLAAALAPIPHHAAAILLAHHPDTLERVDPDRSLVILSGHTHGGQIALRFPSPEWVCRVHLRTRYVHGWYHRGRLRLYVNRGLGVTGSWPFSRRYRCPSEITLFRLTGSEEATRTT